MISTSVFDIGAGQPAARIPVELDFFITGKGWIEAGRGVTNREGQVLDFGEQPAAGIYRLMFDVGVYMADAFFPTITVTFELQDPHQKFHIPLLLSRFGYTVYREEQ